MALNVDQLREGLKQYNESLNHHLGKLSPDFEELMRFYAHLNTTYEGLAAEEFKLAWEQTASWFEEYQQTAEQLAKFLEERTDHLNDV